jgi:hypothetical protein
MKYALSWNTSSSSPSSSNSMLVVVDITLRVSNCQGWAALAFSKQRAHQHSDMIVAWIDSSGSLAVLDMNSNAYEMPELDQGQKVVPVHGVYKGNDLEVRFIREMERDGDNVVLGFASNSYDIGQGEQGNLFFPVHDSAYVVEEFSFFEYEDGRVNDDWKSWNQFGSDDGDFLFLWRTNQKQKLISFNLSANTRGWAAFGISKSAPHVSSDVYVFWMDSTGKVIGIDGNSDSYALPNYEETQNIEHLNGKFEGGRLKISFQRPFDTGDSNDAIITDDNLNIAWAYHISIIGMIGSSGAYEHSMHTNAGSEFINLIAGTIVQRPNVNNLYETDKSRYYISQNSPFSLMWELDDTNINFTLNAELSSWIGLSLSQASAHLNSDMYVCYFLSDGSINVIDMNSQSYVKDPIEDLQKDAKIISGSLVNNAISLKFSRPLKTNDPYDWQISNQFVNVGWAYLKGDFSSVFLLTKHSHSGTFLVNFFTGEFEKERLLNPAIHLSIVVFSTFLLICTSTILYRMVKQSKKGSTSPNYSENDGKNASNAIELGDSSSRKSSSLLISEYERTHSIQQNRRNNLSTFASFIWYSRIPSSRIFIIDAVIVLLYIALNAFYAYFWTSSSYPLGITLGYLSTANILITLMPSSRNSILSQFLKLSYQRSQFFHKFLGYFTMALINAHAVFYITTSPSSWKAQSGWIAWGCFALITLTTISDLKEKYPQVFNALHLSFAGGLTLLYYHSMASRPFIYAAAAFFLLEFSIRLARGIWPQKVLKPDILALDAIRIQLPKRWGMSYSFGQSVMLNFPMIQPLKWEKVYISSGPEESSIEVILPPSQNIHSLQHGVLNSYLNAKASLWVRVDGPYESWPINFFRYRNIILFGENSGIFPCFSLLRHVYKINHVPRDENSCILSIFFIWICKNYAEYKWNQEVFELAMDRSKHTTFPNLYVSHPQINFPILMIFVFLVFCLHFEPRLGSNSISLENGKSNHARAIR